MLKVFAAFSYSWEANSYLVYDENDDAILIDPNKLDNGIEKFISDNHIKLKAVCCTHGHFDHISGVDYYVNKYNCRFYIHKDDVELLNNPYKNSSKTFGLNIICNSKPTNLFKQFTVLTELKNFINVYHTPFHTQGCVCLHDFADKILFTGDTLFKSGVGRCDLYGGNQTQMQKSLLKISNLDKETVCFPGHGEKTTIGKEFY